MLTKQDLTKIGNLLSPLVTKKEIQGLATRQELQEMKQGLEEEIGGLATRQELQGMKRDLESDISALRESINGLATAIDGLVKTIDNLRIEYLAITAQLNRHEQWIKQIAQKAKVELAV